MAIDAVSCPNGHGLVTVTCSDPEFEMAGKCWVCGVVVTKPHLIVSRGAFHSPAAVPFTEALPPGAIVVGPPAQPVTAPLQQPIDAPTPTLASSLDDLHPDDRAALKAAFGLS